MKLMLFDQDGTLYEKTNPIIHAVRQKVIRLIAFKKQIDFYEAKNIYFQLPAQYKNPFEGLASIGVLSSEYWEVFDAVPVIEYIRMDKKLKKILDAFSVEKHIVTFASKNYSVQLIKSLGLSQCFKKIINIDQKYNFNKGNYYAHLIMKGNHPDDILVIGDDYYNDILPALQLNIKTVHISKEVVSKDVLTITSIYDLQSILSK